jgi:mono/diheme cytochrome c family protein
VKQISIFVLGFAAAFASASAPAQDLTAGKTPAQLFRSDCVECHRSPGGMARTRDVRALADFLREHYTSKSETAGALAAYVSSFAAGEPAGRNRATAPVTGGYREVGRRNRGEADATANEGDTGAQASPAEDRAGRHRRTTSLSGDREKRRSDSDGEVSRPPAGILTTPASPKSNARTRSRESRDASHPMSRLHSYLSSGGGTENAIEDAGKTRAPKARKRRNRANTDLPTPDARANTKTDADTPPAVSSP